MTMVSMVAERAPGLAGTAAAAAATATRREAAARATWREAATAEATMAAPPR